MAKTKIFTCLEFAGRQYPITDLEKCVKAKVAEQYPDVVIKDLGIYMQPETDYVYYTVNGEGNENNCFAFDELIL